VRGVNQPCVSDYLNRVLTDLDPDQGMEEEYKVKKEEVFSWRFLRQVSFVDLVNFHGEPEAHRGFIRFDGDIEKQAKILYNRNKKRDIIFEQQN
jgi:hypothetical protein